MTGNIIDGIFAVLVAFIMAWSALEARRRKKSDARAERRANEREEESRLSMAMMSASMKLGIATAIAVSEKRLNGEMEAARAAARVAQEEYDTFLRKVAARQVTK